MFKIDFKVILFKMYIQSAYEYCSTLFFDLNSKSGLDRLDKSFCRSVKYKVKYNVVQAGKSKKYRDLY